jgi:hypothetical protein
MESVCVYVEFCRLCVGSNDTVCNLAARLALRPRTDRSWSAATSLKRSKRSQGSRISEISGTVRSDTPRPRGPANMLDSVRKLHAPLLWVAGAHQHAKRPTDAASAASRPHPRAASDGVDWMGRRSIVERAEQT